MHRAVWCQVRVAAIGLCVLLAGCFTSSQPKFPLTSAVAALRGGGHFIMYEREGGTFVRGDSIQVKHRADGAYDFVDPKGEVTTVSFHRIGPERYVAQGVDKDGAHTDYAIVQVHGDEVLAFAPDCAKEDAKRLVALGVAIEKYRCVIDRVADPTAFFASLTLGDPTSKLVRE